MITAMGKSNLLLTLHFCAAVVIHQTTSGQKLFDLGPKAGISSNDLSLGSSHTAVVGWQGGLFARIKPPLFPGLQGEVLLSSIGSDIQFNGAADAHIRSFAVQVPVFIVFAVGPVELHCGGYYDRFLSTSAEGGVNTEGSANSSGTFSEGDYGLLLGAGLHLDRFYAGARYNYGLKAIGSGDGFLGDASNRQAQAYVAYGLFK